MKALMFQGKALIVFGPRQAGKTTVIQHLLQPYQDAVLEMNGDDQHVRDMLADCPLPKLETILGGKKILFVDEAQRISEIGLTLKRAIDRIKGLQVIVSGSSSLDLASKTAEPLTGRKFEWSLLPFSFQELVNARSYPDEISALETRLVYGSYPEIIINQNAIEKRLNSLAESYLFKDILSHKDVRRPELLDKILKALSFQCGSEVSFKEVGDLVGTDNKTVERYIDVLKKVFIVFEVPSYSHNLRNELKKSKKFYFYDNGIRNAVINDYRPLVSRNDVGVLWENYMMSERLKWRNIHAPYTRAFFWRTLQQQEIDLVEESAEGLSAFEFKWNANKHVRQPTSFMTAYPMAKWEVIHPKNYDQFLT